MVGDRRERLAPRDAEHVAALQQAGEQARGGARRRRAHDDRAVTSPKRSSSARERSSRTGTGSSISKNDAFAPGLLEQAQHLEARDAEPLGDLLLRQVAHVVETRHLGHCRSAHWCILLHR